MTLEADIQAVRAKVERARSEKARREALADQAKASHDNALTELRKLGHETPESAKAEADELRASLEDRVKTVETKLAEASA